MNLRFICLSVIFSAMLFGCASNKSKGKDDVASKLDILTDFSVAINENNFMKAVGFLVDEDKLQLVSAGSVSNMAQKQLKALRLQKLIKDRRIGLREGKLTGIVMVMPKLNFITQGQSSTPDVEEPVAPAATDSAGIQAGGGEATPAPALEESAPEAPEEPVSDPAEEQEEDLDMDDEDEEE